MPSLPPAGPCRPRPAAAAVPPGCHRRAASPGAGQSEAARLPWPADRGQRSPGPFPASPFPAPGLPAAAAARYLVVVVGVSLLQEGGGGGRRLVLVLELGAHRGSPVLLLLLLLLLR